MATPTTAVDSKGSDSTADDNMNSDSTELRSTAVQNSALESLEALSLNSHAEGVEVAHSCPSDSTSSCAATEEERAGAGGADVLLTSAPVLTACHTAVVTSSSKARAALEKYQHCIDSTLELNLKVVGSYDDEVPFTIHYQITKCSCGCDARTIDNILHRYQCIEWAYSTACVCDGWRRGNDAIPHRKGR